MSIVLHNVGKSFWKAGVLKPVLRGVDLRIQPGDRIGILGLPKSGKTTLLRLICGSEFATEGRVDRNSTISWPIPLNVFLSAPATVASNIAFIARVHGLKPDRFIAKVAELGDLKEYLGTNLEDCPRLVRPQLTFAVALGLDFDFFLFDELVLPAPKELKSWAAAVIDSRLAGRGLILATGKPKEVEANCNAVFILDGGRITFYPNVKEGIKRFKALLPKAGEGKAQKEDEEPEEEAETDYGTGVGV